MKKPTPPSQADIDNDLEEALKALGAKMSSLELKETTRDKVLKALRLCWENREGPPPTTKEIAQRAGLNYEQTRSCLQRLAIAGEVLHPRETVYVPKPEK